MNKFIQICNYLKQHNQLFDYLFESMIDYELGITDYCQLPE